jgi:DNA-binding NtrC family response regulator
MASRVWVVDDDDSVREVLTAMLTELGYEVKAYADPHEALTAYLPGVTDIIVTDLRMPKMSGLELTRALLVKDPEAIVMVLTGYPSIPDAVEAVKSGATDFLSKPCRMEEIRIRLERALESRELQDRLKKTRSLTWILIGSLPLWFVLGMVLARFVRW